MLGLLLPSGTCSPTTVTDHTVDSHVKRIRMKLRAVDPEAQMIVTVAGVGYRLSEKAITADE